MTAKTRLSILQKIKIAQRQLEIDEEAYQAILQNASGLKPKPGERLSATKLSDYARVCVLKRMRELGFVENRPARAGRLLRVGGERGKQHGKIQALLAEARRSTDYADGIAKKMFGVEKIEFLTVSELSAVITALEKDARRAGRETA